MLQKSKAIVLHTLRYKDNSLIVYCYSEQFGRITFLVNGAFKTGKLPGKAVYFQHFAILDVVFYQTNRVEMCRVKEVSVPISLTSIPFDPVKRSVVLFLSEVIYRTVKEEESNPTFYSFLENTIHLFDITQSGVANFHLVFLLQLSRYLGFYPTNTWTKETPYFDYKNGTFVSFTAQHRFYLDAEASKLLSRVITTPFHKTDELILNHNQRLRVIDGILNYYRFHLGNFLEFNSLPVLSQLYV